MQKSCVFIVSCLLVLTKFVSAQQKVPVDVYYESLCPDSIKFFTKQLYPALQLQNLAKYVELNLIPYGKTSQEYNNNEWSFNCHHGPNECYGNKIQACALSLIPSDFNQGYNKAQVAFINCVMSRVNRESKPFSYPGRECANTNNIQNYEDIEKCANSTQGSNLLSHLGQLTQALKPELKSVPTVVFAKLYSEDNSNLASKNFPAALCQHIRGEKPIECKNATGSAFRMNAFTPLVAISTVFFAFVAKLLM